MKAAVPPPPPPPQPRLACAPDKLLAGGCVRQCDHIKAFLLSKYPEGALIRDNAGLVPFERRTKNPASRQHLSRAPSVIGDAELDQRVVQLHHLEHQRNERESERESSSYRPLSSRLGRSLRDGPTPPETPIATPPTSSSSHSMLPSPTLLSRPPSPSAPPQQREPSRSNQSPPPDEPLIRTADVQLAMMHERKPPPPPALPSSQTTSKMGSRASKTSKTSRASTAHKRVGGSSELPHYRNQACEPIAALACDIRGENDDAAAKKNARAPAAVAMRTVSVDATQPMGPPESVREALHAVQRQEVRHPLSLSMPVRSPVIAVRISASASLSSGLIPSCSPRPVASLGLGAPELERWPHKALLKASAVDVGDAKDRAYVVPRIPTQGTSRRSGLTRRVRAGGRGAARLTRRVSCPPRRRPTWYSAATRSKPAPPHTSPRAARWCTPRT